MAATITGNWGIAIARSERCTLGSDEGGVVLVLGGTGNVGRYIVRALLEREVPVRVVSRNPEAARELLGDVPEVVRGDIADPGLADAVLQDVRGIVVSVAAMTLGTFRRAREIECDLVTAFLERAREAGVRRVVLISIYDIDLELAARLDLVQAPIKDDLETALAAMDLNCTVFGQGPPFELFFALIRGGRVMVVPGGGPPGLPVLYTGDTGHIVAEAVLRDDLGGRRFRLAGPESLSFREAARRIGTVWGWRIRLVAPPLFIFRTIRWVAGLFKDVVEVAGFVYMMLGYILLMNEFPKHLLDQAVEDHRLLRDTFTFTPTTLEDVARRLQSGR